MPRGPPVKVTVTVHFGSAIAFGILAAEMVQLRGGTAGTLTGPQVAEPPAVPLTDAEKVSPLNEQSWVDVSVVLVEFNVIAVFKVSPPSEFRRSSEPLSTGPPVEVTVTEHVLVVPFLWAVMVQLGGAVVGVAV